MSTKSVWLTVNELTTDGTIGETPTTNGWSESDAADFANFIDPNLVGEWATVATATSTIKLYAYDAFHLTEAQLQAIGVFAQQNGYKIVMEAGVLQPGSWNANGTFSAENTPPSPGTTGTGWGVEGFNGAMSSAYARLQAAGVKLDYVAMDEGFGGALQEGWTPQQIASDTAAGLKLAQGYFPNIQFGDIENLQSISTAEISSWISAYHLATGQNLAFFQADTIWGPCSTWAPVLEQASNLLGQLGIPLDILIAPYGVSSSVQWTDTALNNMINIYLDSKISFNSLDFQSWDQLYPTNILSEATAGTLTNAAQEYLDIDPVNVIFEQIFSRSASYFELFYYAKLLSDNTVTISQLASAISRPSGSNIPTQVTMQDGSVTSAVGIAFMLTSTKNATLITIETPGAFTVPQYVNSTTNILLEATASQASLAAIVGTISCQPVIEVTSGGIFSLDSSSNYVIVKLDVPRVTGGLDSGIYLNSNSNVTVDVNNSGINNIWIGAAGQTVVDTLGYSCTYVDASLMTANTTINDGGQGQLNIYKGGTVSLGNNVEGVGSIVLYHDGANQPAYKLTTSVYQHGITVYSSGGNDTISLGDASQIAVAANTGTLLVKESATNAGATIIGHGVSSTTLEITSSGTATLSADTNQLTVKLDQAGLLITNSAKFILVDASIGGTAVVANGQGQTVFAGASDNITDASKLGITLIGNSGQLQGDVFNNFNSHDIIDVTNFDLAHSYISATIKNGISHVVVHDLGSQFDFFVTPAVPSIFHLSSDGQGGLNIHI